MLRGDQIDIARFLFCALKVRRDRADAGGEQRRAGALRPMRFAFIALLLAILPPTARAGTFIAYGPQRFTRDSGAPAPVTAGFTVLDPATAYTLRIDSAGVSSAAITLNGVEVVGPNDFNSTVTLITRPVTLRISNQLTVEMRGRPAKALPCKSSGLTTCRL
ncbi:MAG: hypothetical protein ACLGJB_05615 [Blastocatellia bacterium]